MFSNLGLIFTIVIVLSIIFSSVYLLSQYMKFMAKHQQKYSHQKPAIIIEKHFNNNFRKNKNERIIIDIEAEEVESANNRVKYLTGDKNAT
mgnify:CR=1 FL=1